MGRSLRQTPGGFVYHVLNRANGRLPIFTKDGDYRAFENLLIEALDRASSMRLLDYCIMPNHWHMILWPLEDNDLSAFMHWLTLTHSQRWKAHYDQIGIGHLYQGRFKSFPVQEDDHFFTVCRYVERNALRAGLVDRAEYWRWGSLWHREHERTEIAETLGAWPLSCPENWIPWVNQPLTESESESIRKSVKRGKPFGLPGWTQTTAERMGLEGTLRNPGRPATKKKSS